MTVPVTKRFAHGLVVGKFSPLHPGHEWLLDSASEQCTHLTILSYSVPEFEGMPAATRERWLALRYPGAHRLVLDAARLSQLARFHGWEDAPALPHNDSGDEPHRAFVAWICRCVLQRTVDAVFTSERYGDGFAQYLQHAFAPWAASGTTVAHVCVDMERRQVPISGTAVRAALPYGVHKVHPAVRGDLVQRICIVGGESSGKSTFAQQLADALGATWVPEFGRDHWVARGGQLSYPDLMHIAQTQVVHEDEHAAESGAPWLVCDTSPLTTLLYCLDLFGKAPQALWALAARPYHHVFLCESDFPFVQDGTRRDDAFRCNQHAWYRRALHERDIVPVVVSGPPAERVAQALDVLRLAPDIGTSL